MDIHFTKFSNYNRGLVADLLSDAYAFDDKYMNIDQFRESDDFWFDNLDIADRCGFVTTLGSEVIGFISWDPRNMPAYAIIGDNCIVTKHKGEGYGKLQLQEAVNRIAENGAKKIFVSTNIDLVPAQRMYESVGFVKLDNSTLESWQIAQNCEVYYVMDMCAG